MCSGALNSAETWGGVFLASLNAGISFLLAVVSYLKLDAQSEAHKISAHQYDKLQSIYLAYGMAIYCIASIYYLVRTRSVGTPFKDSLTPKQIKIKKVGVKRSFSLMSEITDKGIRMFHNDMVGKTLYVDKTTLEDMIQFQNVEFEIIRGYYYDEGRNYKLKEVIQYLFNVRLRQKKLGNPIQNIFKLIMNSAYGKTLLKPIDDDVKYVYGEDKMMKIVLANYAFIKEVQKIGEDNWEIKMIKSINSHYNNACCGVEVLSMSKRIMNEVMCLSEDKGYNIYYQDTDSLHIDSDNVDLLAKDYKEKYDRDLIGKQMGQFHTDFDSDKLDGTIYAKESIFLGKKCYVDVLTDDSGKIDYHIRMKGVSSVSVKHHATKDFENVLELFKHLYSGKEYTFDLTCNGSKACFDMVNMNTIKTKTDFMRKLVF